jgi:hypothetical protein
MKTNTIELIILANSIMPGGRCVAGIDRKTGKWMRPKLKNGTHVMPNQPEITNLKLLDIVEVPFLNEQPNPIEKYQIENEYVADYRWKKIGTATIKDILQYVENSSVIFHSSNDRVDPSVLENISKQQWKSLQLIETDVIFIKDRLKVNQWRSEFKDGEGNTIVLKVTDLVICEALNAGQKLNGHYLLTISLGQPWQLNKNMALRCYKLVAGAIRI